MLNADFGNKLSIYKLSITKTSPHRLLLGVAFYSLPIGQIMNIFTNIFIHLDQENIIPWFWLIPSDRNYSMTQPLIFILGQSQYRTVVTFKIITIT